MSAANGTASLTIHKVLDEAVERAISAGNRVRIIFVSVNGYEDDTSYFNECFAESNHSVSWVRWRRADGNRDIRVSFPDQ
jgi:hypothetical protein